MTRAARVLKLVHRRLHTEVPLVGEWGHKVRERRTWGLSLRTFARKQAVRGGDAIGVGFAMYQVQNGTYVEIK